MKPRQRIRLTLGAAVLGSLAFSAAASAADPLPITALSPSDGASFQTGQTGYPFSVELTSVPNMSNTYVEVSTSNLPGQDGSLADDFVVESIYMFESDAFAGTYTGKNRYTLPANTYEWPQKPGTYYWQIRATCSWIYPECGGTGGSPYANRSYLSPVRAITVAAPPPPTGGGGGGGGTTTAPRGIRSSDVSSYTRFMIRQKTNGRVRGLSKQCSGQGTPTVACYLVWKIGRYRYEGTAKFRHYVEGAKLYWYFSFKGTSKKIGCRGCRAKRLRWS